MKTVKVNDKTCDLAHQLINVPFSLPNYILDACWRIYWNWNANNKTELRDIFLIYRYNKANKII